MSCTFALVWLSVALGQVSKSVETASNLPMPLILPPFRGSGFVPTDSMPDGLRWFAEYQPFTPIIETLGGLLMDKSIGNNAWVAFVWCAAPDGQGSDAGFALRPDRLLLYSDNLLL